MTVDSIANIGRGCLMTLNSFSLLLSVAVMAIGLLVKFGKDVVDDIMDKLISTISSVTGGLGGLDLSNFDLTAMVGDAAIGFIIIGLALSALAGIGIFGAKKKIRPLLISYAIILVVIFVGEIISIVFVSTQRSKIDDSIKPPLKDLIRSQYVGNNRTDMVSLTFNFLMISLSCCGIDDYSDFNKSESWERVYVEVNTSTVVDLVTPISCCKNPDELDTWATCATTPNTETSNYLVGCYDALWKVLNEHNAVLIGVLSFVGLFEVVLVFFAGWLSRDIGKEIKEMEEKKKNESENKQETTEGTGSETQPAETVEQSSAPQTNQSPNTSNSADSNETPSTDTSVIQNAANSRHSSSTLSSNAGQTQQQLSSITSLINALHNVPSTRSQTTTTTSNQICNNGNSLSDMIGSLVSQTLNQQRNQHPVPYNQPPVQQQQYYVSQTPAVAPYQLASPFQPSTYPSYHGQLNTIPQYPMTYQTYMPQNYVSQQPVWYYNSGHSVPPQNSAPYFNPNLNQQPFRFGLDNFTPPPYSDVISHQNAMHVDGQSQGHIQGNSNEGQSTEPIVNYRPAQNEVGINEGMVVIDTQNSRRTIEEAPPHKELLSQDKLGGGRSRNSLYRRDTSADDPCHVDEPTMEENSESKTHDDRENTRQDLPYVHELSDRFDDGEQGDVNVNLKKEVVTNENSKETSPIQRRRLHLRDIPKLGAFSRSMVEIPVLRRDNISSDIGRHNNGRHKYNRRTVHGHLTNYDRSGHVL